MTFTYLFILALVLSVGLRHWLAMRQIRHVANHRASVPNEFAHTISLVDHQKAADYTIAKLRLGLTENFVAAFILISFTLLGGLELLNQTLLGLLGPGILQQMALLVSIFLISGILDLPFTWKKQFGIEAAYGFNRMTPKLFWLDMIKGIALASALGLPLLWLVLELMSSSGPLWWLWTWIVWTVFNALLLWLFPTFIAPLFNKFKALEEGSLNFKRQHIRKRLLVSFALSFVMLAILGWVSSQPWFYLGLGVTPNLNGYNGGLALALFMLVAPVFSFFFTPLASLASRKHEYEADHFAAQKSSASALISALVKLYQDNASTLTPDPLYTAFYSSHPPAPLRIAHLQRFA